MNNRTSFRHVAALATAILINARVINAQIAPAATMTINPSPTGTAVIVTDSGDHVWVLQRSFDFSNWTEIDARKVHNGTFHWTFGGATDAQSSFYRVFYEPSRQTIVSTIDNALHLPGAPFNYSPPLPPPYLSPQVQGQDNTPTDNPVTNAGATLGRVLFYDKRLSTNGTIACASCHQPRFGFADPRPLSVGFNGGLTGRNSMGLSNARFYRRGHFFWDERAATLEDQVLQPIQNSVEMGMTLPALVARLSSEPFYTNLFAAAFGAPEVTTNGIARALAQFVRSIVSTQSKYDAGLAMRFTNFTAQENLGRQIFFGQVGNATCAGCHTTDTFSAPNIFNNGLEFPFVDRGVGAITGLRQDNGLFKVPSLRNIELTAPYMHDGRFATLEEVVEFYNSGVVDNPSLGPALRTPTGPGQPQEPPRRLNLTTTAKQALVSFLKTLTDTNLTTDVRFSDPFNYGN